MEYVWSPEKLYILY